MRFAIFTHVIHQKQENKYFAYSPYVKEMNIWLKYVEEVEIVAPLPIAIGTEGEGHVHGLSYEHPHLILTEVPSFDLLNKASKFKAVFKIPSILLRIIGAMHRADHLHLRCPGNIGLLACICQIFFPHKQKTAKYAGNWDPDAKQPWSYKLQKWILSNTFLTRNMTVLVYGDWLGQSKNILPFFTASFSGSEIEKIEKDFSPPYKLLFVGNLVPGKQPLFAAELVKALNEKNINAELHVYGDGEMMEGLKGQVGNKDYIHLYGNQSLDVLKQAYKESHFLILASKSEGWPKAVAEAMFFGCIPVASGVSCVPWMLGWGSRGILISDSNSRDGNPVDSGQWTVDSQDAGLKVEPGRTERGGSGLLDTFQKNRQFECLPDSLEGARGNVSRTGFSETPASQQGRLLVTSGKNKERQEVLENTVERIIELIKDPERMKRMSMEAQEWSQQYTLEKFEVAIKEILSPSR